MRIRTIIWLALIWVLAWYVAADFGETALRIWGATGAAIFVFIAWLGIWNSEIVNRWKWRLWPPDEAGVPWKVEKDRKGRWRIR